MMTDAASATVNDLEHTQCASPAGPALALLEATHGNEGEAQQDTLENNRIGQTQDERLTVQNAAGGDRRLVLGDQRVGSHAVQEEARQVLQPLARGLSRQRHL